ncbi:hypothetical protein ACLKA6_010352 [Drosophila palustris]
MDKLSINSTSASSSVTPVNHPAGVSDNATRANINPFANSSRILRSPPAVPHSAPPSVREEIFTFMAQNEDNETPKRNREQASPQGQNRRTPPKRQRGPCASPRAELIELGEILDDLIFQTTEKKPVVRHVTMKQKEAYVRMKQIQVSVSQYLEMAASSQSPHGSRSSENKSPRRDMAENASQTTPSLLPKEKAKSGNIKKRGSQPPRREPGPTPDVQGTTYSQVAARAKENHGPVEEVPVAKEAEQKWQKVKPKAKQAPRRRNRPDAILVKCKDAADYAKVLASVQTSKELQQYKENVRGVRRTAAGEVLLQMSKTADDATSKLHHAVQKALGESANVTVISDKVRLEIRDLPEWASAEDVTLAVLKHMEGDLPVESAPKLRKGYRGTQIASMFLTKAIADTLLAMRDIRIGWALCSIRSTVDPRRCYKCLEFGHTAARCRSKHDASKKCFNCGGEGHSSKDCTHMASCILCTRAGAQNKAHNTLSKGCPLAAQDLLSQTVRENAIDIAILCEHYRAKQDGSWLQNHSIGAAIWSCGNPASQLKEQFVSRGFVRSSAHTYTKAGRGSIIDLTFASPCLARNIKWAVSSLYTHSDHQAVLFTIGTTTYRTRQPSFISWAQETLDDDALLIMMDTMHIQASDDADVYANNTALAIQNACNASMLQKRKGGNYRKPVHWWNGDIADARKQCLVARRRQQRSRGRPNFLQLLDVYREKRAILKRTIKRSKALCWDNLCAEADEIPFGTAYKIVMGKLARRPMPTDPEQLLDIVTTLFPEHPAANLMADTSQTTPRYTGTAEVLQAAANIKVNKAPGPDGVPSKVVKIIAANHPEIFVNLFNACIRQRTVPKRWKLQRLVQRRSNLQKRCDNDEMAGEMESYCKRQLDETYRPGHTAVAPSVSLTEYGAIIDDIAQDARGKASVIIAGDFNAWATEWGSKSTTPRGSTLLDTFASLQVCLLNTGTKSTFSKAGRESIIDVTFASPLLARGSEWCVSDIYTHSDHLAVLTTLAPSGCHSARAFIHESYKTESLDMDCLLSVVSGLSVRGDANSSAEAMADGISAACNASMAKVRRGGNRHRPVAWWNEEIAVARMECHAARRRCQRTRSSPLRDLYATVFKGKRRELKEAIKRSKARHFQELCDAADSQPFGAAYKLVMRKLCRQPMPTRPHQLSRIVHTLFPRQPHLEHTGSLILQDDEFVPTNSEEVLSTTAKHEQDPYCDHCGGDVIEDAEHSIFHCPLFTQERELAAGPNTPLTPGNLVATMIATEHGWAAISTMASIIMKELRRRERSRREHSQTSD